MIYSIYRITNKTNGKCYIGFTSRVNKRRHEHFRKTNLNINSLLYRAMKKHGIKNFIFEVIYQSKDEKHTHNIMEPYFIKEYAIHGYNMTTGGDGGATRTGAVLSDETKRKISKSVKKTMNTSECQRKLRRKKSKWSKEAIEDCKKRRAGLKWISNLNTQETKMVHDATIYLNDGWIAGRKFNNPFIGSETNYGNHRRR